MTMQIPPVSDPMPPIKATTPQPAPAQAPTPAPVQEEVINPNPQEQVQVQNLPGSAQAPVVSLVNDAPDLKAHGEQLFSSKIGAKNHNYLRGDNPKLLSQLKEYCACIEKNPDMKKHIGRNPRGIDFLDALEKASKGQKLSRDDIQSIQLFLRKDTRFGDALGYEGEPEGMDGKCGVRTLGTLDHFVNNYQPSDLVDDPYYQRLDHEGVHYSKL
ncbi:MAG TPA: hypothetical protein V6D23_23950 [Candidatus Obscuribacterales bacterium]